jgi:hypothetical protein
MENEITESYAVVKDVPESSIMAAKLRGVLPITSWYCKGSLTLVAMKGAGEWFQGIDGGFPYWEFDTFAESYAAEFIAMLNDPKVSVEEQLSWKCDRFCFFAFQIGMYARGIDHRGNDSLLDEFNFKLARVATFDMNFDEQQGTALGLRPHT